MILRLVQMALAGILLVAPPLAARENGLPCAPDFAVDCVSKAALRLLDANEEREAVDLLKAARKQRPDEGHLSVLLAKAYLATDNTFWALRVLNERLSAHPGDCEASLWLAWVHLRLADLEEARFALGEAECPAEGPWAARRELMSAMIERHGDEPQKARDAYARAHASPRLFPEDRRAVASLKPKFDPWYVTPLSWRVELWAGYTSNALAGSPQDPAQDEGTPEGLFANISASLRFVPNLNFWLHPSLEGDLRMMGYATETDEGNDFLLLSGRPGLLFGGSRWSVLAAYRHESLLLGGGDRYAEGPLWFYQAHRGELEASPLPWLTLFAGAGARDFRERGRSRVEVDGGIGGGYRFPVNLQVMGALSSRWFDSRNDAYDIYGFSLLGSLEYFLPYGMSLRAGFSFGFDYYPRSAGYFDALKPDTNRRDILLKPSLGIWSPVNEVGLRGGLVYEFSERLSRAEPYAYRDHRVLLKLTWAFALDPWLPRHTRRGEGVPMNWGLVAPGAAGSERIQDLIRQDEAVQRGSSCVE